MSTLEENVKCEKCGFPRVKEKCCGCNRIICHCRSTACGRCSICDCMGIRCRYFKWPPPENCRECEFYCIKCIEEDDPGRFRKK